MDAAIYPYRLAECNIEIANELHKADRADTCGGCGKPFNAVRKLQSIARVSHVGIHGCMHAWTWPLCRKCTRENLQKSGGVHERLQRQAFAELVLLATSPGGAA